MRDCWHLLAVMAMFSVAVAAAPSPAAAKMPVVLDTDIGDDIDDTWALAMLLKSPEFDVKLVTTTYGKAEYRAKLIAKMLTVARRTDIPIGLGAGGRTGSGRQQAWVQDYQLADHAGKIHDDGVGALIELIDHSPEPVTLIAIGPLQTVAAALERGPEIAGKASFVGMHGSVRKGYVVQGRVVEKPMPEYNVKTNVAAARKVLSAPWRQISITPLDTCGLVDLSGPRFQTLKDSPDPLLKAVLENYRIWAGKERLDQLQASSTLFDPTAIYLALPGARPLMKLETLSIAVTDDGLTRIDPTGTRMSVATSWQDLDGFRDLLVKILTRP